MALELLFYYFAWMYDKPTLSNEEKRRRDRRTPRIALRRYTYSSFSYLFKSGDDQALLNCCGCDHEVFRQLLGVVAPILNMYTMDNNNNIRKIKLTKNGKPMGRKRDIDAVGLLGLVLYWYRTRGSVARGTAMAFGLTATPMYKWLSSAVG